MPAVRRLGRGVTTSQLTEAILWRLVPRGVFERGREYYEDGAVRAMRRQGRSVEAEVRGGDRYLTRIDLDPPFDSACTCPYEGTCKHVVALGLAWLHEQASVPAAPEPASLADRLAELDSADLCDLVLGLVDDLPQAWPYVDRWLLGRGMEEAALRPGPRRIEQRLAELAAHLDERLAGERLEELDEAARQDWTEAGRAAQEELDDIRRDLESLVRELAELPDGGEPFVVPALVLCCERFAAAEGAALEVSTCWADAAAQAASALAERLLAAEDATRAAIQERLLAAYQDGAGFLEPVLLAGSRDPAAARRLADRLGAAQAADNRGALTAVKLLLEAGLAGEAQAWVESRAATDAASLILLARHFRTQATTAAGGGGDAAAAAARAIDYYRRAIDTGLSWTLGGLQEELASAYDAAGLAEEALAVRVRRLCRAPSLDAWRQALATAQALGRRAQIEAELLAEVRRQPHAAGVLCDILVDEAAANPEHLQEAAALARAGASSDRLLQVAEAAAAAADGGTGGAAAGALAIALLQEAAEQLALQGGDVAYARAASALARLGGRLPPAAWTAWLAGYVARHRRRRNLLSALRAAGLWSAV